MTLDQLDLYSSVCDHKQVRDFAIEVNDAVRDSEPKLARRIMVMG